MNTHEYQAKIILREFGVPITDFAVVSDMNELQQAIKDLKLDQAVLKVQIHAGGRGKAGGVKIARNYDEIISGAKELLGMKIVNNQTGKDGIIAREILVSPLVEYVREYYIGITIDRRKGKAMFILSPDGGTEIEEIALNNPEKIMTCPVESDGRIKNFRFLQIEKFMQWEGKTAEQGRKVLESLARAFIKIDASLLEINPLVKTTEGNLIALDAKLSIDENALYRQTRMAAFYDATQSTIYEAQANQNGLSYIALDGEIGCMVNGAGLAMATMDIIKYCGGTPANFLDVGGGASQEKVAEGFKIILSDPKVKAILVNIFGGIMNCVTLAAGIIAAASELQVKVPLIVRMEGTNVEQGKKMLANSGLNITIANSLGEAAQIAVDAAKQSISQLNTETGS